MGVVLGISYLKLWTINKLEIKKKKKIQDGAFSESS